MVPEKLTFSPLSRRQIEADFSGGHITSDAGCGRHLLVKFIRQYWTNNRIVFRGDSGFYRPRLLSWCDRNNVDYLMGLSKNSRQLKEVDLPSMLVCSAHGEFGEKVSATYRPVPVPNLAPPPRWVIARLEEGELGANPRFIISSRCDDGVKLYYEQYCARGDMENRIKDQQLCLFADRTSSTRWWTNQWQLLLSSFAYALFERLRAHLKKTPFEENERQ